MRRRCPQREHAPRDPAELEAWRVTASAGAWRAKTHPRWTDAQRPVLDWPACRAAHDPDAAPWGEVRALLSAIEDGARKGAMAAADDANDTGDFE